MKTTIVRYVYMSLSQGHYGLFVNDHCTKKYAVAERRCLRNRGCPVGPIVKVVLPLPGKGKAS